MAWNEPGGSGNRDPWGNRQSDGGPPDLDEVVRKMQEKLSGLFGGRGTRAGGGGGGSTGGGSPFMWLIVGVVLLVALVFEISYVIEPGERAVVLRFGRYVGTLEPGINFRFPRPIEFVEIVNVDQVRSISHKAAMLTQDENIVDIDMAVQYKVKDVKDYVFNTRAPDATLRQAVETAIREIIGSSKMDFLLTEGRGQVAVSTRELMQNILDGYGTGLHVDSVNIQSAKPPEEVKSAFDDAIKAREDEQRLINEAEAYRNEVIPKARGAAARIREEANAYKDQVAARAQGDASRFMQLLSAYELAPEIMRQRLYIESLEAVLSNSTKVMLDTAGTNNLVMLPLDQLMDRARRPAPPAAASDAQTTAPAATSESDTRARGTLRDRDLR